MSNQSTNEASTPEADERAQAARTRRSRDEALVTAAKDGDASAYRQLVDAWAPAAFDRALHRGADERSAGDAALHAFDSLQAELVEPDTSFGARVMGAIERDVPARPRALGKANRGAKRAAERLTRGTDPAALGADPSIGVMLWDALEVLGEDARDVTDMHWRHGLASDEIAAATGKSIFRVDDILRKAPQGLSAALRTRLLWAGGKPDHDELTKDLKANSVRQFDSLAVRVIHAHLRACSICRSRSLIALPAIDIFAAIPLVAIPGEVERRISATAWTPGVAATATAAATVVTADTAGADASPELEASPEIERPEATAPAPAADPTPATPTKPSTLEERARGSARSGGASAATAAAASSAAAAFLAPKTKAVSPSDLAAPDLDAPDAATPDAAPLDVAPAEAAPAEAAPAESGPVEPATEPSPAPDPPPASESTAPPPALPTMPLAALSKTDGPSTTPTPPTTTALPRIGVTPTAEPMAEPGSGPTHEPVASQAGDGHGGGRPKWLIPAGIAAAAVILIGLVVMLTRGGGDNETAIDTGPLETTTTTRAPASTTTTTARPTTTDTAPPDTTVTPNTTAGGGGGTGNNNVVVPPTTKPPATTATVTPGMSPGTIENDPTGGGAVFSWSVNANGPVNVSVTGPGVSSSELNGSMTVCSPPSSCGVGTHYFSIVVKDAEGRQVTAATAKLIVRD